MYKTNKCWYKTCEWVVLIALIMVSIFISSNEAEASIVESQYRIVIDGLGTVDGRYWSDYPHLINANGSNYLSLRKVADLFGLGSTKSVENFNRSEDDGVYYNIHTKTVMIVLDSEKIVFNSSNYINHGGRSYVKFRALEVFGIEIDEIDEHTKTVYAYYNKRNQQPITPKPEPKPETRPEQKPPLEDEKKDRDTYCDVEIKSDFNLKSPSDMPTGGATSGTDKHNDFLYYGGLASGIDPAMLKVIFQKESGGNIGMKKSKMNTNGTYDNGPFQINDIHTKQAGKGGKLDVNELLNNPLYNLWAATEIIKAKKIEADNASRKISLSGTSSLDMDTGDDTFVIFWRYNGFSANGKVYAKAAEEMYLPISKLTSKIAVGREEVDAPGKVLYKNAIVEGSLSYEEFIKRVECISDGDFDVSDFGLNSDDEKEDEVKRWRDLIEFRDRNKGTGVEGEKISFQRMKEFYNELAGRKLIIKAIYILNITGWLCVILVVFLWALLVAYKTFPEFMLRILDRINITRIDFYSENALRTVVTASLGMIFYIMLIVLNILPWVLGVFLRFLIILVEWFKYYI